MAELVEVIQWPNVRGVGRMFDNERAVLVCLDRKPSDDEIRAIHERLATRPPASGVAEEGWKPGQAARYSPDFGTARREKLILTVEIVAEIEGWYEVRYSDDSTAIVRPSHLAPALATGDQP